MLGLFLHFPVTHLDTEPQRLKQARGQQMLLLLTASRQHAAEVEAARGRSIAPCDADVAKAPRTRVSFKAMYASAVAAAKKLRVR